MTNYKTSTAQAIVDAFKKENVEYVFGLTGSHVLPITDALVDAPQIRHIVSKHESHAAYMAGMYGYLSGRPGVVLVTAGPGTPWRRALSPRGRESTCRTNVFGK